jgi:hypothetical protein
MAIRISTNGILAFAQGIPKLNTLITRSRNNLTIVHGKGNGEHILGMSHEATRGTSGINLPKPQCTVPASTEGELPITRDDHVGYKVRMAAEGALGVAVAVVLSGVGVGEAPADDGFVAGAGEYEVGVFGGGGDGCYPVAVAAEGSSEGESFGHGCWGEESG